MRVLLSCVGTRDPYWKEEIDEDGKRHRILFSELRPDEPAIKDGPILSLISAMKLPPDKVYLLSTAEGKDVLTPTQRGGEKTAQLLEERNIHAIHWPLYGVNPISFESLMPEFTRTLRKILGENGNASYSVNVASGTPQMQAVWYVLVHSGLLKARLLRAVDNEIHEVDIDPLFEGEIKNLACSALESFSFSVAGDLLSGPEGLALRTRFAERRQRAELFGGLCKVYAAWTVFDYNLANKRLKQTSKNYEGYLKSKALASIAERIKAQQSMLAELVKPTIPPRIRAIDVFHNAWVHYEMRHYADTVWRASTSCELAAVGRVMRCLQRLSGYTFRPNKFSSSVFAARKSTNPGSDRALVCDMLRDIYYPKQIPLFLAGGSAMRLLREIDQKSHNRSNVGGIHFDRLGSIRFDKQLEKQIQALFDLRNGLVHQLQSIKQQDAKHALEVALSAIKAEFGEVVQPKLEQHPFSVEVFRGFANDVRRLL